MNDNHGHHLKERKLQVKAACAEVDNLRAALQSSKEEAERARGDAQEYANRLLEWSQKPGFATTAQLDSTQRYCARLEKENAALSAECEALRALCKKWADCSEYGWTVIANASGGNWEKEHADWQKAAARFRDECYYQCLDASKNAGKGA